MAIPQLYTVVTFGRHRGHVVGYTVIKRKGSAEEPQLLLIVELDAESASYLEPREGYDKHDSFVSLMVVDSSAVDLEA